MKTKTPCIVVTFHTTAEAMATEKLCRQKGITGKLISAPRQLTADCGIAWRSPAALRAELEPAILEAGIDYEDFHETEL